VYLKQSGAKTGGDPQWALYREEGDPELQRREEERPAAYRAAHKPHRNGKPSDKPPDWLAVAKRFADLLTDERRNALADALGLPVACLDSLPLLGWNPDNREKSESEQWVTRGSWPFPEVDGSGRIIGINRRYEDGRKKAMSGASRGLTVPTGWDNSTGTIYLPEGQSTVLAMAAMGLAAIGRPSNEGGAQQLGELLRCVPWDRPIVVLGDHDPKDDGKWPGRDGAMDVANALRTILDRPVSWALPPGKAKDVRQWLLSQRPDLTSTDALHDLGEQFERALTLHQLAASLTPPPSENSMAQASPEKEDAQAGEGLEDLIVPLPGKEAPPGRLLPRPVIDLF
jgi:hypothetical protein